MAEPGYGAFWGSFNPLVFDTEGRARVSAIVPEIS